MMRDRQVLQAAPQQHDDAKQDASHASEHLIERRLKRLALSVNFFCDTPLIRGSLLTALEATLPRCMQR
jgi:hypothetical protein